jgi:hypothetical protein
VVLGIYNDENNFAFAETDISHYNLNTDTDTNFGTSRWSSVEGEALHSFDGPVELLFHLFASVGDSSLPTVDQQPEIFKIHNLLISTKLLAEGKSFHRGSRSRY